MDMSMVLHFGEREIVLFSFWKTGTVLGMVGSMFIIFLLSILFEAVKAFRYYTAAAHHQQQRETRARARREGASSGESARDPDGDSNDVLFTSSAGGVTGFARRVCSGFRLFQAFLYGFQALLAYALMLVVMTYNVWLILAVVLGVSVGYLLFTGTPIFDADLSDCC